MAQGRANGPAAVSIERITAWGRDIKEIGEDFVQCPARRRVAAFPGGFVLSECLLGQPVGDNFYAGPLPTVVVIRPGQCCCARRLPYYVCAALCLRGCSC